jgi:hypothetical protein
MWLEAKAAGGRWNPEKQLWFAMYSKIAGTPLGKHIPMDASCPNKYVRLYKEEISGR